MSKIFAIAGATGNIGSKTAEQLLAKGHQVRVIGRSREKLARLVALGESLCRGLVGYRFFD